MKILTTVIRGLLQQPLLLSDWKAVQPLSTTAASVRALVATRYMALTWLSISGPSLLREQDASSTCLYCHQQAGDIGPTTTMSARRSMNFRRAFLPSSSRRVEISDGSKRRSPGSRAPRCRRHPALENGMDTISWPRTFCTMPTAPIPLAPGGTYPAAGLPA